MASSPTSDPRFSRILQNVPREVLTQVASARAHKPEALTKDKETLVTEVFRICSNHVLDTLFSEYPGPSAFSAWFFGPADDGLTTATVKRAFQSVQRKAVSALNEEPQLYDFEDGQNGRVFRFAAKDSAQNLRTDFGESERIEIVNYYTVVIHFSTPKFVVFGPYAKGKAVAVMNAVDSVLSIGGNQWSLLAPPRGGGREFYNKVKKALKAFLIETKRHDPSGNYKTIAWQAREKYPDLEDVPDFKNKYLHADSMYDVLEFNCKNSLSLAETTHVKFGYPFGRFNFKAQTSLSAMIYFEDTIRGIL
jgi:hypothetical protein